MADRAMTAQCHLPTPNKPPTFDQARGKSWLAEPATWERSAEWHWAKRHVVWRIAGALGGRACWPTRPRWRARRPRRQRGAPGAGSVTTDVVLPSVTVTDPVGGVEPAGSRAVRSDHGHQQGALHALLNVQGLAALGQSGPS